MTMAAERRGGAGVADRRAAATGLIARLRASAAPQRELLIAAISVLAVGRLVDASVAWVIALLLAAVVVLGTRAAFRAADPEASATVPPETGLVASVLAAGLLLVGRWLPADWSYVVGLAVAAALLLVAVLAEGRALTFGATPAGRVPILGVSVIAAFVSFTAIAGLVAGGLSIEAGAEPGELNAGVGGLSDTGLIVLAAADALVAGVLSYRLARLLPAPPRAALAGAASSAAVVALAVGLLRAIAVPLAAGPILLTIVFVLWDSVRSSSVALRRDPRWVWQLGLLGVLGIVVVGWNLALR
jgi:hypothetical protein